MAIYLSEMDTVVPWSRREALIAPICPKKGNGRPPMPLGTMLRIHFMQQWFGYSDPATEEALHDVPLLCQFAGSDAFDVRFVHFTFSTSGNTHDRSKRPERHRRAAARHL